VRQHLDMERIYAMMNVENERGRDE
jgi:hypothetical protein